MKKPSVSKGSLKSLGDLLGARVGPDGGGQRQVVGGQGDRGLEVLVKDRDT